MLDKIVPGDLLPGMQVITRKAETGLVRICSIRFEHCNSVMTDDYTDDLFYGDGDEEHDLDIMRVALPSGAVIWERPIVEVRVFEEKLFSSTLDEQGAADRDYHRANMNRYGLSAWFDSCDGRLATFKGVDADGDLCDGYLVRRAWTRELTAEERANWKGARK